MRRVRAIPARGRRPPAAPTGPRVSDLGAPGKRFPVTITPRFLELFSSNLYTSPNKAFEELVSNAWDAGASATYIGVPSDLKKDDAVLWVLDNGKSMNQAGLELLWTVGASEKREAEAADARPPIGKFGIGKLATFLLAKRLTYVCRSSDGVIRLVEMDYTRIGDDSPGSRKSILRPTKKQSLNLQVRTLTRNDLTELFKRLGGPGKTIAALIAGGIKTPKVKTSPYANEFGGPPLKVVPTSHKTWTLAVMMSLKDSGKRIQAGRLRYMLETALPLGQSMAIVYNGEPLQPRLETYLRIGGSRLGPALQMDSFPVEASVEPDEIDALPTTNALGGVKRVSGSRVYYDYPLHKLAAPFAHVRIGTMSERISGSWSVFSQELTGKKADERGRSHGYFINVRGRVINSDDPYFELKNLNHTAWAHFRATVRADWLDDALTVNRQSMQADNDKVELLRLFLRALFNKARGAFDTPPRLPLFEGAGEKLASAWGAIPLQSLRSAVSRFASTPHLLPPEIRVDGIADIPAEIRRWTAEAKAQPASLVREIKYSQLGGLAPLYAYDLGARAILVNLDHPMAQEFGARLESKNLMAADAVAEILSDAHLTHIGVAAEDLTDFQRYRDDMRRIIVQLMRRSAVSVANALINSTDDAAKLELAATEALQALGFDAHTISGAGRTDGLARSPTAASNASRDRGYTFTYDAKSARNGKVKTQDLKVEKLQAHRQAEKADYTLIVAPEYEDGQVDTVCANAGCTPIRARTLAKLLMLVARVGSVDLMEFEAIFERHSPDDVERFVDGLVESHMRVPNPSLQTVLSVLDDDDFGKGKPVNVEVLADRLRREGRIPETASWRDITRIFLGLAVLVPKSLRVDEPDKIWFATSPHLLLEAVHQQIRDLPEEYRLGLDRILSEPPARRQKSAALRAVPRKTISRR